MTEHRHLSAAAWALRIAHAAITATFLAAIVHIWVCAATRRRNRWLHVAAVAVVGEGVVVAANHGDCPLGPLQQRLGDPVPLFELVLSPAAARRAVPALGCIATAGLVLLKTRPPHRARPSSARNPSMRCQRNKHGADVPKSVPMAPAEVSRAPV